MAASLLPLRIAMVLLLPLALRSPATGGDLLRGGAAYGTLNPSGSAPATSAAQAQVRATNNDVLAKTTQALQAVQAMQIAAQKAAQASANNAGLDPNHPGQLLPNVPNGLTPGGLVISGAPVGASAPTQSGGGSGVTVTVNQTAPQAFLTWSSFNVGKNTTLLFNQSAGGANVSQWIAFNKVTDPSGIPSQILGSIQAQGQVYVINQNGIIFGGSSQVNVHTLVASSLPINDNLISRGLLNNPDAQFLFSALPLPAGTNGPTAAFTPPAPPNTSGGKIGDVTVQPGAMLESPASAASVGGRIALIGPNVTNAGTISTPDGQTILAAGLQVGFAAHNTADPSLRGLDVFVGQVGAYGGTATNSGFINVIEGNAYLTGKNVNQMGVINSSTSVSLNGRIDLLAQYNAESNAAYAIQTSPNTTPSSEPFLFQSTGVVTLGAGSVTQVLPELSNAATIIPTVTNGSPGLAISSQINLQGLVVHLGNDAVVLAPSGTVNVQAGQWFVTGNSSSAANVQFLNSAGQIYLDSGAVIDVSGSIDVSAPITQNIIQAQLRGAELADSPLQRDGPLRGSTVTIDIRQTGLFNGIPWIGSPIANLFGYASTVPQTVAELTINGGTVNLSAGNSVVMQPGSLVNVSGGWINYGGGMVQTTRVMTAWGQLMDISQATPDLPYAGIYTGQFTTSHPAWGISNTFTVPWMTGAHFEQGYSFGGNGGTVNIAAPSTALDGALLGVTVAGPRQQSVAPVPSSLSLSFHNQELQSGTVYSPSPTPPTLTFQDAAQTPAAPFALDASGNPLPLRADRIANVYLSPNLLTQDGFGTLSVDNSDGNVIVPAGVALAAPPGGSVSLSGSNITIRGSISAPGGSINLTVSDLSPFGALQAKLAASATPSPDPTRGLVTLGPGASLDTAGLVIDNRPGAPAPFTLPQAVNNLDPILISSSSTSSNIVTVNSVPNTFKTGATLLGQLVTGISGNTITLAGNASTTIPSTGGVPLPFGIPVDYLVPITTTNGGHISINTYSANLLAGSLIDVSGGVLVSPTGKMTYGNGGSIIINTGLDPNNPANPSSPTINLLGGTIHLGATLMGFSGAQGGSLSIQAQQIIIGSEPEATTSTTAEASASSTPFPIAPPLVLSPDFFSEGGFTSFTLTGFGTGTSPTAAAVEIAPNTVIAPVAENRIAILNAPGQRGVLWKTLVEPLGLRTPVSLSFVAKGASDTFLGVPLTLGNFIMGQGAVIQTDPALNGFPASATVSISAQTIAILGSISAPGGVITLKGAGSYPDSSGLVALPTVYLGPQSVLSAAGTTVFTPNPFGEHTGYVLPGGIISVSGNIVAMAGAVLDVSGSSGMIDVPPASLGLNAQLDGPLTSPVVPLNSGLNFPLYSREVVRTRVDSNGGSLTLAGVQELFTDATLLGAAGGPTATGGTLSITSGRFVAPGQVSQLSDISLVVTQNQLTIPSQTFPAGQTAIGNAIRDAQGKIIPGMGYFAANSFLNGGFDSLSLGTTSQPANVEFSGPVSITARNFLQVATGGFLYANSSVNLTAPYVALGTPFQAPIQSAQQQAAFTVNGQPFYFPPTFGPGVLTVHANYIDVGNLSLQGIGQATLIAKNGDIRGDGTLDIQGNLILQAAQIYPATEVSFTIAAYDYTANGSTHPGSVTILQSGQGQAPLSASGVLSIYASNITQSGTLLAPFGTINLGYDGTGTAPTDNLAGPFSSKAGSGVNSTVPFPVTQQLTLTAGSVTSVAGIDPVTGKPLLVPFGVNLNGTQWIDPSGLDITAAGVPLKSINIQSEHLSATPGSSVSIQGGGDLFGYRFVPGLGGSTDILASSSNFAVIPGFSSLLFPYAPYNQTGISTNNFANGSVSDLGYVNANLRVGEQVYLSGSNGLPAGVYTLLPARYALLPGGALVTPASGNPIGNIGLPDGSSYVDGYLLNGFNPGSNQLTTRFQVFLQSVVNQRAEYDTFLANSFFPSAQQGLNVPVTRLPMDAGHLVFEGIQGLSLEGQVQAGAPAGGLGGLVDISTPLNIYITGSGTSGPSGDAVLSSSVLNSWGAASLLIGGVRTLETGAATVEVTTSNITVNNAGSPLTGSEIILAANKNITLAPGASIQQSGSLGGPADTLTLNDSTRLAPGSPLSFVRGGSPIVFPSGSGVDTITSSVAATITNTDGTTTSLAANTPISLTSGQSLILSSGGTLTASGAGGPITIPLGDGTLLRVSSDPNASIVRNNVTSSTQPDMVIGAGAKISGGSGSLTLDSTYATSLNASAILSGNTINLDSGQISFLLNNPGTIQPTVGLVLSGSALQSLQSAQALSFLSYSSIDIYGTGQIGTPTFASLALHAGEIRGFNTGGGAVTFDAHSITLDNRSNTAGPGPVTAPAGSLVFNANTIQLGANQLDIDQYSSVTMNAPAGIMAQGQGGLSTQGSLTMTTSLLTAGAGATQNIISQGVLTIQPSGANPAVTGGLGASLTLQGATVTANSPIILPSGLLTLHATTGNLTVSGTLAVTGTSQVFFDLVKFTDAGQVTLISDAGLVILNPGSVVDVSASPAGGNAGTLTVQAPSSAGAFSANGTLLGVAGLGGQSGSFSLDVGTISNLAAVSTALDAGGFTQSRSLRIRNGDVTIDTPVKAFNYSLSADNGTITVTSTIDASGVTGGTISLAASGSIIISSGADLTVAAQQFNDAGKGGAVTLEAGSEINGVINSSAVLDIQTGSTINLSVGNYSNLATLPVGYQAAPLGDFTGTLHLRAPQNSTATSLAINPINGTILNPSSVIAEGYHLIDLTPGGGGAATITSAIQTQVMNNGNSFASAANTTANFNTLTSSGSNAGLAAQVGNSTTTAANFAPGTTQITLASAANFVAGQSLTGTGLAGGTTILSVSGNVVTLSAPTTGSGSATSTVQGSQSSTATFAQGVNQITVASTTGILPGDTVSATGVPFGTTILAVHGNSLTLSASTTSAGTNTTLTVLTPTSLVSFAQGVNKISVASATGLKANEAISGPGIASGTTIAGISGTVVTLSTPTTGAGATVTVPVGANLLQIVPGEEIINRSGNLVLSNDWDLSTYRFGTNGVPGVLTLRAQGNLVFNNSLSDGFAATKVGLKTTPGSANTAQVMTQNLNLPANEQSWSINLAAGADLNATDLQRVLPQSVVGVTSGSLLLGQTIPTSFFTNNPQLNNGNGAQVTTSPLLTGTGYDYYQVIRTGTGDINVSAANNVLLLNPFASIYTAGVQVTNPTLGGAFATPSIATLTTNNAGDLGAPQQASPYPAQYTMAGGNVLILAQGSIAHGTNYNSTTGTWVADSEAELPINWLDRRGFVGNNGVFGLANKGDIASTSWWVDFSNFFEGVGALGGGNVTLNAGENVSNVDALIPTNARMTGQTAATPHQAIAPNANNLVELGGGDLLVKAGNNIDAGVYYVERGNGILNAGGSIITNSTRSPALSTTWFGALGAQATDSNTWLPTTLFLGQGSFNVSARGSVLLGPAANPFLLPEGYNNTFFYKTYFNTYGASDAVDVSSLGGNVTLRTEATLGGPGDALGANTPTPLLEIWLENVLLFNSGHASAIPTSNPTSNYMPWLRLDEDDVSSFNTVTALMPPTLRVTSFAGDINLQGNVTLFPSPTGTLDLAAKGSINALQPTGQSNASQFSSNQQTFTVWAGSIVNLSDANPASLPSVTSPFAYQSLTGLNVSAQNTSSIPDFLGFIDPSFSETGSTIGQAAVAQTKVALHDPSILHLLDPNPVHLFALSNDISGLTLFSGKAVQVAAGQDITNVSFYIQNVNTSDVSFVSAGRDIVTYAPNAPLILQGLASGNALEAVTYGTFINLPQSIMAGDIQISGPGTLEVLAGRNLNLGDTSPPNYITDGTAVGITSIGNARNPALPFAGADLVAAAGIGPSFGLSNSQLDFSTFISQYLTASSSTAAASSSAVTTSTSANTGTYLADLASTLTGNNGVASTLTQSSFMALPQEQQDALALQLFLIVLRDAGRTNNFSAGTAAISTLFPKPAPLSTITVTGREIKTVNGGNLTIVDPAASSQANGQLIVGLPGSGTSAADQGIFTVDGGNVGIFTNGSTTVGISRIFTLHGGNITIWSSTGNIDAGAAAKTVTAAPPTRVLIDPQSADVQTDLGGLATGGGIGVLATVVGVPPGSVDLIAPVGTVNAGDAGIRATGTVNIAAAVVLNASNITAASISGVPSAPVVAAPNIGGLTAASSTAGATAAAATDVNNAAAKAASTSQEEQPSDITVEVIGYGGTDNSDSTTAAPSQ